MLTGALTLSATALAGCGLRLEDDAPDIPFVPERDPIPGEAVLLAVLGALEASDEEHAAARADRLRSALARAEVPEGLLSSPTTPQGPAETVAAFEGAVRDCGPGLLPLVGRLTATHRITARTGAGTDLWTPPGTKPWEAGSVAADALDATRATIYALDLIAAKTSGRLSKGVRRTSRRLQDLVTRQTTAAGSEVRPATLGYDIAHELTPAQARELGTRSFARLLAAYADGLAGLGQDRTAALEVTQWIVTAEAASRDQFPLEVPVLYGEDPEES